MSSMWRAAVTMAVLIAAAPSGSTQYSAPVANPAIATSYRSQSIASALETWRALRQSSGYRFAVYAGFLLANSDWPDAPRMRAWAEKAMQPGEDAATVIAFFAKQKPDTGTGWARLADAYSAAGRPTESLDAARQAWRS